MKLKKLKRLLALCLSSLLTLSFTPPLAITALAADEEGTETSADENSVEITFVLETPEGEDKIITPTINLTRPSQTGLINGKEEDITLSGSGKSAVFAIGGPYRYIFSSHNYLREATDFDVVINENTGEFSIVDRESNNNIGISQTGDKKFTFTLKSTPIPYRKVTFNVTDYQTGEPLEDYTLHVYDGRNTKDREYVKNADDGTYHLPVYSEGGSVDSENRSFNYDVTATGYNDINSVILTLENNNDDYYKPLTVDVKMIPESILDGLRDEDWNTDGDILPIYNESEFYQFCYLSNIDPEMFSGKTILLMDDIDISAIKEGWPGIVLGIDTVFNGNGYSVTIDFDNIPVGTGDTYLNAGLITAADTGSVISNLTVNGTINSPTFNQIILGGIVGFTAGDIINCESNVNISSTNGALSEISYIGGIAGYSSYGEISNCVNNGDIYIGNANTVYTGGICGFTEGGIISNCLNTSNITDSSTTPRYLSGICSKVVEGKVTSCLNLGQIGDGNSDNAKIFDASIAFDSSNSSELSNNYMLEGTHKYIYYRMEPTSEQLVTPTGINQDLVDKLNNGDSQNGWRMDGENITSLLIVEPIDPTPDEPETPSEDDSRRPGHSYSLEEREPDDDEEKYDEPEQTEEAEQRIMDIIGHWAEPYIRSVLDSGYMDTVTPTQFLPDSPATRITVADGLYRLSGRPAADLASPFTDTSSASALWLYNRGVISGFGDGTFRPTETVTREQLAVFIYNYMAALGMDVSDNNGMNVYKFSDYEDISGWAFTAVRYCVESGILSGNTDGTFNPEGNVTRAELAVILNNISQM